MLLNAYTLYDCKSLTYSPPFYAVSDGLAVRMVSELVTDKGTTVGRHPKDFTLYCVGQYNDADGGLLPLNPRRHVIDALATMSDTAHQID